ncbi:VOC family protein [Pseudonocardia nigra]|uniref:VOC family protein n=1 Tax=Pseudonocardia nigra TaxID=1921578 RepID=UPI001C5FBD61|nr:VOC family protein [Pseudonocardia nigra]
MTAEWKIGTFVHLDLTVPDAPGLRDFYADVVGWKPEPLGDDWMMLAADGTPAAGVCHARGENADLPPQWLAYIAVDDLDASLAAATRRGGEIVAGPKGEGPGSYAVIRDPAGAVLALIRPAT